jgi:hypothetical protein
VFDELVFQGIFTDEGFKVVVDELVPSEDLTTNVQRIY